MDGFGKDTVTRYKSGIESFIDKLLLIVNKHDAELIPCRLLGTAILPFHEDKSIVVLRIGDSHEHFIPIDSVGTVIDNFKTEDEVMEYAQGYLEQRKATSGSFYLTSIGWLDIVNSIIKYLVYSDKDNELDSAFISNLKYLKDILNHPARKREYPLSYLHYILNFISNFHDKNRSLYL